MWETDQEEECQGSLKCSHSVAADPIRTAACEARPGVPLGMGHGGRRKEGARFEENHKFRKSL